MRGATSSARASSGLKYGRLGMMAIVLGLALAIPATAPAFGQADTGEVTVLHGVPGLTVDVYANGDRLIEGFEPGTSFGPADLPAGDYSLAVRPAGADADSDPAISGSASVSASINATIVAHLTEGGDPTLSVFANDVKPMEAGDTRVTVRHTAAFGAVDVLADGSALFEGLTNPDSESGDVPAGSYDVEVTAAGDPDTVAYSATLDLEEGTSYLIHAIGDPGAETFDVLVQTIDGLHTAPEAIASGTGGAAADAQSGMATWAFMAILVVGLLGMGVSSALLISRNL